MSTKVGDDIKNALDSAATKFKQALKNRQSDSATAIRRQIEKIKNKDSELNGTNPTGNSYSSGSRGRFGEAQTEARMNQLGYQRVSDPDKNVNATGIDDIFIHTETGHVAIVESKFNTSRLGTLNDGTQQMSYDWLTSPSYRVSGDSRIDVAMNHGGNNTGGLEGPDVLDGLDGGLVSTVLSHIDLSGNVTLSFLD